MTRADIQMAPWASSPSPFTGGQAVRPVEVASGVRYYFFIDASSNCMWTKSSDGITWTDPVAVQSGAATILVTSWYDRWTPGNSGNLIHIAMIDSGNDDVTYRNLDVSSDTLSTQTTVFAGATLSSSAGASLSITRAIGGNLG